MHDGWPAYKSYLQCRHALCGAHLLRELTYIEENSPHQRGQWAAPLSGLLLETKAAVERTRSASEARLDEQRLEQFRRRYEALLRRGLELNPERTKPRGGGGRGRGASVGGSHRPPRGSWRRD